MHQVVLAVVHVHFLVVLHPLDGRCRITVRFAREQCGAAPRHLYVAGTLSDLRWLYKLHFLLDGMFMDRKGLTAVEVAVLHVQQGFAVHFGGVFAVNAALDRVFGQHFRQPRHFAVAYQSVVV